MLYYYDISYYYYYYYRRPMVGYMHRRSKNNSNVSVSEYFNDLSLYKRLVNSQNSLSLFLILESSLYTCIIMRYGLMRTYIMLVQYLLIFFIYFFHTTITVRFYCQTPRLYFQLAKLCETYNNSCDKNNIYTVH